jgi:hypothetical protein
MIKGISYLGLALCLLACKAKKEVQTEAVQAADTHLQEPQQTEAAIHLERNTNNLPDSLVARIQRTACFGRCPIYTLSVYESGYVDYIGEKWVEKEGRFSSRVDQSLIDQLMQKAKAINYFELEHTYDSKYVTDLPATITTLKGEDGFHVVVNRYQAPEQLTQFAQEFDQLFQDLAWKSVPIK